MGAILLITNNTEEDDTMKAPFCTTSYNVCLQLAKDRVVEESYRTMVILEKDGEFILDSFSRGNDRDFVRWLNKTMTEDVERFTLVNKDRVIECMKL